MNLIKAAKKEHFPCDICGEKILIGESFYRTVRSATTSEIKNPNIRKWNFSGVTTVGIKLHKSCHDNARAFKWFVRNLPAVRAKAYR